jgi:hypothetical protein
LASLAAIAAGCATETPYYSGPQSLPAQGGYAQPSYGYGSGPYYGSYGYGSGSYYGPYGYSPGAYYGDPRYYGQVAPYGYGGYYYPYPVIVRCPDKNSDGRCDKPAKQHDGNGNGHQGGGHVDLSKYRRDARGIVPPTRVPNEVTRTETTTRTQTVTQPVQPMRAQEPRVIPPQAQLRNDHATRSQNSPPSPARPANVPQQWPQQAQWPQQRR